MTASNAQLLHNQIVESYGPWLAEAPQSYTEDSFFMGSLPITITSRCGQNQQICDAAPGGTEYDEEAASWSRLRDFSQIKYVSLAIASHASVAIADKLVPRPKAHIVAKYGDNIWDGICEDSRQQLSGDDLDELDEDARIFTDKGFEILRHYPIWKEERKPCGVLVDFKRLNALFQPDVHLRYPRAGPSESKYSAYPQAGLVTAGYLQATSLISEFYPLLEVINTDILSASGEDLEEELLVDSPKWPVYGVSCQIYNAVMHHTRGKGSQHHEVARGMVSGALGGLCISKTASSHRAEELLRSCGGHLPHESYELKASNREICKDLRLENVYWMDFDLIPEGNRDGSYLYHDIVQPLTKAWCHSAVVDKLKDNVVLFMPKAFPAVYSWMTYPLTVLLKSIWDQGRSTEDGPSVKTVELCSIVERALNFMHTGNTAVLLPRLMGPLWTSQGLLKDGWPCFNRRLVHFSDRPQIELRIGQWPFDLKTRKPISAAFAGQMFYYNANHAGEYLALLAVEMASTRSMALRHMPKGKQRLEDVLAYILAELFIGDVVSLVWKVFGDGIEAQRQDEDPQVARVGKRQKRAYTEWSKLQYPLAMDAESVRLAGPRRKVELIKTWDLLSIIAGRQANFSHERWTTEELGGRFVDMAKATSTRRVKAPLVHGGLLHHALPVALERLTRRSKGHSSDADIQEALEMALGRALEALRVELVPHHEAAKGQSHRLAADPRWWARVSHASQVARASSEELSSDREEALMEAARSPTAPWDMPFKPQDIKWFVDKTVLPQNWGLEHASLGRRNSREPYILDTYEWVRDNYDGEKALHRMALLWSIMFCQLLPRIGVPKDVSIKETVSQAEATSAVFHIPWEVPARKGNMAPLPFLVMVTCVIISFFEPQSPLRRHLARNKNKLGNAWTSKHGMKCINAVMLIRMKLAVAKTSAVAGSPRFKINWDLKDRGTVESLYLEVVEELKGETSFALYNAYSTIFGEEVARYVARKFKFDCPLVDCSGRSGAPSDGAESC